MHCITYIYIYIYIYIILYLDWFYISTKAILHQKNFEFFDLLDWLPHYLLQTIWYLILYLIFNESMCFNHKMKSKTIGNPIFFLIISWSSTSIILRFHSIWFSYWLLSHVTLNKSERSGTYYFNIRIWYIFSFLHKK